jgi:DNA-binding transcriptional MerR regulator
MEYTVKDVADLAGVSVRTLHYYDEIGLLTPSRVARNGYRSYGSSELFRLQQILILRELGFELKQIAALLDDPDHDPIKALHQHRQALGQELERLSALVATIDSTVARLQGGAQMEEGEIFRGLTRKEQERFKQEAIERWGEEQVSSSYRLWDSYSGQEQQQIIEQGNTIYSELAGSISLGPEHPQTQSLIARWHRHLRYFYEPSIERLRGLGELYVHSPEFADRFRDLHPELPEFLRQAITVYCDHLGGK